MCVDIYIYMYTHIEIDIHMCVCSVVLAISIRQLTVTKQLVFFLYDMSLNTLIKTPKLYILAMPIVYLFEEI